MDWARRDALVVGMTLVPSLVSRNRCFDLFEDREVRRAKARSAVLRGIVRHIAGMTGCVASLEFASSANGCELRYVLPEMRLVRRAHLAVAELACVRYLAGRAGPSHFPGATDEDRAILEASLRYLARGLRLSELHLETTEDSLV
jgi:hypothetical protein